MKLKDMIRDDYEPSCNQHPETCSDPYCREHN
jgi:hypothetical protein